MSFELGDKVELLTGSETMIVEKIHDYPEDENDLDPKFISGFQCFWRDSNENDRRSNYQAHLLKKVDDDKGKAKVIPMGR